MAIKKPVPYLELGLRILEICDAIYVIPDEWRHSQGTMLEARAALNANKEFFGPVTKKQVEAVLFEDMSSPNIPTTAEDCFPGEENHND